MPRVLLLTPLESAQLARLSRVLEPAHEVTLLRTHEDLTGSVTATSEDSVLICFGTGVVVPKNILNKLNRASYNFHAAPPEFPGRDPHHFAVYNQAKEYGATVHILTERVDEGPIVAVKRFPVPEEATPQKLLALANECLFDLFEAFALRMAAGEFIPSVGEKWAKSKPTRQQFLDMCRLPIYLDREEFERRYRAFDGGQYNNLTVELHGHSFRIDKSSADNRKSNPRDGWKDFTEQAYRSLLGAAKARGYAFAFFDRPPNGRHVLWRHDVDFSLQRALRLARMEHRENVCSTFFINPHSVFYNCLEPESLQIVRDILSQGHRVGLHFDADAYPGTHWTRDALQRVLKKERMLLETFFDCTIKAFSFHNPDTGSLMNFNEYSLAGMVNTYSADLQDRYEYCSDSNGYWRHRPIPEVVRRSNSDYLHVLTHPAWWTKDAMPPRLRIERCVQGRAMSVMRDYEQLLKRSGRRNIP